LPAAGSARLEAGVDEVAPGEVKKKSVSGMLGSVFIGVE